MQYLNSAIVEKCQQKLLQQKLTTTWLCLFHTHVVKFPQK